MIRYTHGNTCVLIIGGHLIHILYNVCENYHVMKYLQFSYFLAISGTDKPIFVFKTLKKPYAFSVH